MRRWWIVIANLAACGRVGFGELGGPSGGDSGLGLGGGSALRLGALGEQSFVQLGDPAELHVDERTIEMWLHRLGAGDVSGSGNPPGALSDVVPLLTKGRGEDDVEVRDINFFVALDPANGFAIAADFEEGPNGPNPSENHSLVGTNPITIGAWHHIAVAYDRRVWSFYRDGVLDRRLDLGQAIPIASGSAVDAVIGGASNSTGDVNGFFDGFIDELRVWDRARSGNEISADFARAIASAPGLVARWSFDEGTGATIVDSQSGLVGTVEPAVSAVWADGAPID